MDPFLALVLCLTLIMAINFGLQLTFYLQRKNRDNLYQTIYWVLSLIYIVYVGILNANNLEIILSLGTSFPGIIMLTIVAGRFCNINIPSLKYISFFIICLLASSGLALLEINFTVASLPIAFASAIPLIHTGSNIFIHCRKSGYLYFALSVFMIILGIHLLDFPFLRLNPDATIWGFTIYFMVIQGLAMIFPALSAIQADKKNAIELKKQVIEKTHELQRTIDLKDITYQVLVHDFANYVFALQGGTRAMKKTQLSQEQMEINTKSDEVLGRMKSLIQKIRQLERILINQNEEQIAFEFLKLHPLVEALKQTFAEKLQSKGIQIKNECDSQIKVRVYEPFFTTSILGNYVSNAIKFSKENTCIEISSEETKDHLFIRIKDTGIGIPEEDLIKINDAKSPTRRKGTHQEKGTGLGTLIANNYLRIHGLDVRFDSIEAHHSNDYIGETTVTITFQKDQFQLG